MYSFSGFNLLLSRLCVSIKNQQRIVKNIEFFKVTFFDALE